MASGASNPSAVDDFVNCFSKCCPQYNSTSPLPLVYTPNSPSYLPILTFSAQNPRFALPETPKPVVIITPVDASQIKAAVVCARKHGLEFRIRSGGHDFEGLSFVSNDPFVLLDLFNLRSINIDEENATAWVQTGATVGELMYNIAQKSKTLGFTGPASSTASLGLGGFVSGGGGSTLSRKYGVAADNVIDALFMDAEGNISDRKSMGEDLFWAIRGGGGGNFGIVLAWKLNLVPVPEIVTVFKVVRKLEQGATKLIHLWQSIAHKLDRNLYLIIDFQRKSRKSGLERSNILVTFAALYLGKTNALLPLMKHSFPELGLQKEDCKEMSWIESVPILYGYQPGTSIDVLLNRQYNPGFYYKVKSEFVSKPVPETELPLLLRWFSEAGRWDAEMKWLPFGGRMDEIPESEIPYPHRAGNLYEIHLIAHYREEETQEDAFRWIRKLYQHMTPYVEEHPRASYVNLRDIDLGTTTKDTTPEEARVWGEKYFKGNYDRLVLVKSSVDPSNFFWNQQSIPPLRLDM